MGADAVLVGRAVAWGLTVNGTNGVTDVLQILYRELYNSMKKAGFNSLDDIREGEWLIQSDAAKNNNNIGPGKSDVIVIVLGSVCGVLILALLVMIVYLIKINKIINPRHGYEDVK